MTAAPPHFALRISIFYAASFVIGGLTTPFLPVWLQLRGFGPEQIAACLAFPLLARLIFTPVGSWIADQAPNRRFAIIVFSAIALALFVPATLVQQHLPILVLTGLAITVSSLTQPATDALALTGYRRFGIDYGSMRVWGSISFVVVSLGAGAIIGWLGRPVLTPLLIASFAICFTAAFALPVTPSPIRAADDAARPPSAPAWAVLTRPVFLAMVVSTSLIQASHGVFYGFGSIHWTALGFSGGEIGALWAIGVIAEIAMFRFSGRFVRFGGEAFILAGGIAAIVRWSLLPFIDSLVPSLLLQILHGLTFGAAFVGMQMVIAREVEDRMTASAQGICQVASGLLLAGSTLLGGLLYARFEIWSSLAMVVPAVIGVIALGVPRWLGVSPKAQRMVD